MEASGEKGLQGGARWAPEPLPLRRPGSLAPAVLGTPAPGEASGWALGAGRFPGVAVIRGRV